MPTVSMPWLVPCNDETPDQDLWDLIGDFPCTINDLPQPKAEGNEEGEEENEED